MKSEVLRKCFFDSAVADCLRAVDGGAIVGSNILALCVIDYLAKLRNKFPGQRRAGENYKALIDDFLKPINHKYVGANIYWLRCALVHTYAEADAANDTSIRGYAMMHRNPKIHLMKAGTRTLYINADTFIADVVLAADSFLRCVHGSPDIEAAAEKLLVVSVGNDEMTNKSFRDMHLALSEFDGTSFDETRFRADITSRYPA